jgi:serine/threonine-protein kinase
MTPASEERDLLFGILAFQMDFISRDALLQTMKARASANDRPLGQVLVEHGALRADGHVLIEALVQKHLELHGNDARQSLDALNSTRSIRAELQQLAQGDGVASPSMTAADPYATAPPTTPPADPFATGVVSVEPRGASSSVSSILLGTTGQRFRIIRPHAKGGLGEVFVAHDTELNREVALKEIQDRHADAPESRARFLLEAEITGGLEHPSIVSVYGLGQYADGRPYYAMRFIRGDSLQDAINRFHQTPGPAAPTTGHRAVEYRQLLSRFIDVCNAMAYAHSRGVIHRDIKPGNVMLGKYGETIVVDWGLAKPFNAAPKAEYPSGERPLQPASISAATDTLFGSVVGTPQFMSPEQAAGLKDQLGPASDIYSLGATLYVLLTGKVAYEDATVFSLLEKVRRGDFLSPRAVNPTVPPTLDAICMKAMALKPEDRYPAARALGDDIEHWLADEPVSAYREPLGARLVRWARRHRTTVAGLAGLLLTAVVALAVSTVLVSREQMRTMEQRRQAEENFQTALRAVNDMLTEVAQEQLANEPRMEKKRRVLLAKAQAYYQQFLEGRSSDPHLRKETALASKRLADISRQLGESEAAREGYGKAIALLTPLAASHPGEPTYRQALGESYCNLGEVLRITSRTADASKAYQQALDVQTKLTTDFPDRPDVRQELALTWNNLGILRKDTQQATDAEAAFGQAIDLLTKLTAENPNDPKNPEYRQYLARAYLNLGPVLRFAGQSQKAEETYQKAIALQNGLVEQDPLSPAYRHELGVSYINLGFLLQASDRYPEAEKAHRSALDLFGTLVVQFPNVPVYRKELANSYNNLAFVLARTGNLPAAEENWRQSLRLFEKLVADYRDVPDYEGGRGKALGNLGWLCLQQKQYLNARTYLEEGIHHVKIALKSNAANPGYRATLRDQYDSLIKTLTALGKDEDAAEIKKQLAALDAKTPKAP